MKTVFLVRHAKSSWDHPNLRDIDRPLNDSGMKTARKMAAMFYDRHGRPDLLISSPAKRAFTTAVYFADALGIASSDIRVEPAIYEALVSDIFRLVTELPATLETVMLFGHNPTFTHLANHFTREYIPNVPTCGIVHISLDSNDWRDFTPDHAILRETYFPKEI